MARINLLPWRAELREERKREFLSVLTGVAVVALLLWCLAHFTYGQWIDYQKYRNNLLSTEITELDKKISEIKDLKRLKEALIARMGIIQELQANRPRIVHLFDEVVNILPKGVHFFQVSLQGNVITMDGVAVSNTNVSQLMRNISQSLWLDNPVLKEIKSSDDQGSQISSFSLVSELSTPQTLKK